jgi:hypothetical protein
MKTQFETGKSYGTEHEVKVLSRTAQFITVETRAFGVERVKVSNHDLNKEVLCFKGFYINSSEIFNFQYAQKLALSDN